MKNHRIGKTRAGTIVVVDFPFPDGQGSKVRPALVLQRYGSQQDPRYVLAMITSNTSRLGKVRSQVLVDPVKESNSGLAMESAVNLGELATMTDRQVIARRGFIKAELLAEVRLQMGRFLKMRCREPATQRPRPRAAANEQDVSQTIGGPT